MTTHSHQPDKTFVDVLASRAAATPNACVYRMLPDDGIESQALTLGELDRKARCLGHYLRSLKGSGERALLLYPTGIEYITAFFGCLYGGVIAVPAYPPRMNRNVSRLLSIIEDSSPKFVLADSNTLTSVRAALASHPTLGSIRWIATDTLDLSNDSDWQPPAITEESTAFLQYTSGSTSAPKGLIVSHGNLLRNEALIQKAFALSPETVIVSWLPIYHDMGLIGNVLASVYNGALCYLMAPASFLLRPATWLEAISSLGATASGGPNFAYDLCVQKVNLEDCQGLDLSRWKIAYNGSEPVRAQTIERFTAKFRAYGFRRKAFFPCYGMAETTLFVTGGAVGEGPVLRSFDPLSLRMSRAMHCSDHEGDRHVSSGYMHVDRIAIVDPATNLECSAEQVGEIWVADQSVAHGYWRKPELSAEIFNAHIADTRKRPFLRTGDLGVMSDRELFVMGRLKDLIIIRGQNHYPQDIENTVEANHPMLRPGCTVAFALQDDNEERLVLVAEVTREYRLRLNADEIGGSINRAVADTHGIRVSEIVFVRPASSLKTSSGKLQRSATKEAHLKQQLEVLQVWRSPAAAERHAKAAHTGSQLSGIHETACWLEAEICEKLRISPARFDRNRPIAEYGLDSLAGAELAAAIEQKLGKELAPDDLFVGEPNFHSLVALLCTEESMPALMCIGSSHRTEEVNQ